MGLHTPLGHSFFTAPPQGVQAQGMQGPVPKLASDVGMCGQQTSYQRTIAQINTREGVMTQTATGVEDGEQNSGQGQEMMKSASPPEHRPKRLPQRPGALAPHPLPPSSKLHHSRVPSSSAARTTASALKSRSTRSRRRRPWIPSWLESLAA